MHDRVMKDLDEVDKERGKLLKKLPFLKRFRKRFMTGDSLWSYNISSAMTWTTAFPAGIAAGLSWSTLVVKYPTATGIATKVWGGITLVAAGTTDIVTANL